MSMTPEQLQAWRWEREIDERNRPLSDEELDAMFPEGYKVPNMNESTANCDDGLGFLFSTGEYRYLELFKTRLSQT